MLFKEIFLIMQKNYTISCCSECPAFIGKNCFCQKQNRFTEQEASNPVNESRLGFPDWCPLPDVEIAGGSLNAELRKVARRILKGLDRDYDDDSVTSIAHYLSTVVDVKDFRDAKNKMEGDSLFMLPSS
jgi:hypothetical protein